MPSRSFQTLRSVFTAQLTPGSELCEFPLVWHRGWGPTRCLLKLRLFEGKEAIISFHSDRYFVFLTAKFPLFQLKIFYSSTPQKDAQIALCIKTFMMKSTDYVIGLTIHVTFFFFLQISEGGRIGFMTILGGTAIKSVCF